MGRAGLHGTAVLAAVATCAIAGACGGSPRTSAGQVVQADGRVVSAARRDGEWTVRAESLDGRTVRAHRLGRVAIEGALALSPSGRLAAFAGSSGGRAAVYVLDLERGALRSVGISAQVATLDSFDWDGTPDSERELAWSPDERRIAFLDERGRPSRANLAPRCDPQRAGDFAVHVVDVAAGTIRALPALPPTAAPLARSPTWIEGPAWSPDGRRILYEVWQGRDCSDGHEALRPAQLAVVDLAGGPPRRVASAATPGEAGWSPDGTHVAVAGRLQYPGGGAVVDVARGTAEPLPGAYYGLAWTRRGLYALDVGDHETRSAIVLADLRNRSRRMIAPIARPEPTDEIAAPADGRCVAVVNARDPDADEPVWRLRVYSFRGALLVDRDVSGADDVALSCRLVARE